MLRLAKLRRRSVDDRARLNEVDRVELVPAVVALVASRLGITADRARALDVPVRQRAPVGGERPERGLLDEVPLVVERAEDVLRDAVVVARAGPREAVIRDAKIPQIRTDELVVLVSEITRRHSVAIGGDH